MQIIKFDLNDMEKKQDGFSCYILGRSYDLEENGAKQDYSRALMWYNKGIEQKNPLCVYSLGISYEMGLGKELKIDVEKGEYLLKTAYPEIMQLINKKEITSEEKIYAEFVTGAYYYLGLGDIKKDSKKAFEIIKRCADNGHIAAIYDLGANFYYNGNGTEMNKKLAEYYLKMAKDAGLKRAIEKYRQYEFGEER